LNLQETDMKTRGKLVYLGALLMSGCAADVALDENDVGVTEEAIVFVDKHTAQKHDADFDANHFGDLMITTNLGSFIYAGTPTGFNENFWSTNLPKRDVRYTFGNFNNDADSDMIVSTRTGSVLWLSDGMGGFTDVWSTSDYTHTNSNLYVCDFNGDTIDDFIAIGPTGAKQFIGQSNGVFARPSSAWSRSSLKFHNTRITVGNFNGDTFCDAIQQTTSGSDVPPNDLGSTLLTGKSGAGFGTGAFRRDDLRWGNSWYTPGYFTADPKMDVMITTAFGSFLYVGSGSGTGSDLVHNGWMRSDLTLAETAFTTGDFNMDGLTDLVISTSLGSFLYHANTLGGFTVDSWQKPALTKSAVTFHSGDFTGDQKSDLIIQTDSGSVLVTGRRAAGGFNEPPIWSRPDLTRSAATFY
jgi:hypothetical protein